jgi:glycosyltransferase involved in cell wall biosynthesis
VQRSGRHIAVTEPSTTTFLFVSFLIMGKNTAYQNLRDAVDRFGDVRAVWVPIEMDPGEWFARVPPVSMNHSLKYGLVARSRVRAAERAHGPFAAAYFNHILPALFLGEFRRRVPCVDSLDVTPADLLRHGQSYYRSGRTGGPSVFRNAKHHYGRMVYRQAAHLLPYSAFTRGSLMRDYNVRAEATTVLPPGVDLSRWRRRRERGEARDQFTVLFVGNDFPRKGGDLVVRLAERKDFSDMRFHIVTNHSVGPVSGNVTIHAGVRSNSAEIVDLYQDADVFVLPTRGDFGPTNAIAEALAMSLPVIATALGGIEEVVQHGKTGFIVPGEDLDAIGEHLRVLRDDPALRRKMGVAARCLAEELLDAGKNAARTVEIMRTAARHAEGTTGVYDNRV